MLKLIFLFSISLISIVKSQQCRQLVRRPEIRELNKSQLDRFIRALTTLRNYRDQDLYAQSSAIHLDNAEYAHGVPAFLPWHRVYLRNLELNLQKIDSSVVLPYWDWSIDAQDPERSVIFKIFGGNGKGRDKCVTDGPFANSIMRVPNRHCLRRDFDDGNKISSLISTEALELILSRSKTFDQFRKQIEGNPHGAVHMNIGGDRGDFSTMYSPNDPIFYLHHVFIDLLWFEWQERNPRLANTYNGRANSRNVNPNDRLIPYNIRVSQALDTRANGYCYYYNRFSSKKRQMINVIADEVNKNNNLNKGNSRIMSVNEIDDSKSILSGQIITNNDYNTTALRNKIQSALSSRMTLFSVDSTNRTESKKIALVKPLSDRFIKMNHLDANFIRQQEKDIGQVISILNLVEN